VVELNYCNNSKTKKGKRRTRRDERKEGKKRRKGGKGQGRNEREKKYIGRKSINRDDESSVGGPRKKIVPYFFFKVQEVYQKLRMTPKFLVTGDLEKNRPTEEPTPESVLLEKMFHLNPYTTHPHTSKTPSILRVIPLLRPNIPTRPTHTHP
jgi:hypothetical protein